MHHRHRILVSAALLSLLAIRPSFAGDDTDVDAGVAAFEQQDYELAIRELEEALADPGTLQAANVPRARYHLGKALLAAYEAGGNPADGPLAEAPVRAADAFLEVRAGGAGEWVAKAEAEAEGAAAVLVTGAGVAFSMPEGEGRAEIVARADRWMTRAIELTPHRHFLYDMRGQIREMAGRTDEAYQDFREAIARYQSHPPAEPDPYIGFTAVRAALVSRNQRGDPAKALAELEEGQALLDAQRAQIGSASAKLQQAHSELTTYLDRARLDVLLNTPELLETALREFETAAQQDPNDYKVLVAYASLLEHTDPDKAIAMYEKAISVDGTQSIAHFNLGTVYFNRGSALVKQSNEALDYEAADVLIEEAVVEMKKARPHMENALSASPNSVDTLQALKQLTMFLGDLEAYEVYKERLEQVNREGTGTD